MVGVGAAGDDEVARVLPVDGGAVQGDGAAARRGHLRLGAVVGQLAAAEDEPGVAGAKKI